MEKKTFKIEQLFLRLRHIEIEKTFAIYITDYSLESETYTIKLDFSDQSIVDAYDGIYELTLILSDSGLDNPVFWNFGKTEVKFKKPLDPMNLSPSYSNAQKPLMASNIVIEEVKTNTLV